MQSSDLTDISSSSDGVNISMGGEVIVPVEGVPVPIKHNDSYGEYRTNYDYWREIMTNAGEGSMSYLQQSTLALSFIPQGGMDLLNRCIRAQSEASVGICAVSTGHVFPQRDDRFVVEIELRYFGVGDLQGNIRGPEAVTGTLDFDPASLELEGKPGPANFDPQRKKMTLKRNATIVFRFLR